MSDAPVTAEPIQRAEPDYESCRFCRTDVPSRATICTGCGAIHKRPGKWLSPRDRLRNDIVGAVLAAWIIAGIVTGLILWAISASTSKSSTTTPITTSAEFCRELGIPASRC